MVFKIIVKIIIQIFLQLIRIKNNLYCEVKLYIIYNYCTCTTIGVIKNFLYDRYIRTCLQKVEELCNEKTNSYCVMG